MTKPITPAEAESLAITTVNEYLKQCRLTHRDQMANYLMKLCSVAGVAMARAEGSEGAAKRLEGTADFVRKVMPLSNSKIVPVQ